jgi:hypothetical protein
LTTGRLAGLSFGESSAQASTPRRVRTSAGSRGHERCAVGGCGRTPVPATCLDRSTRGPSNGWPATGRSAARDTALSRSGATRRLSRLFCSGAGENRTPASSCCCRRPPMSSSRTATSSTPSPQAGSATPAKPSSPRRYGPEHNGRWAAPSDGHAGGNRWTVHHYGQRRWPCGRGRTGHRNGSR